MPNCSLLYILLLRNSTAKLFLEISVIRSSLKWKIILTVLGMSFTVKSVIVVLNPQITEGVACGGI